ncbi:MAG: hypothetical protein ACTSRH_03740 [Promethearchaeota archaeon]
MTELEKKKRNMVNITINIPNIYDENIKKLIEMKVVANRSAAIRRALYEFFLKEAENLELLGSDINILENLD